MRISVQACIEGEGERPSRIITDGVIERDDEFAPSSGLSLFMSETNALLKQLQTVFLDEQVDRFFDVSAHCLYCQTPLGIKDTKRLVCRTVFGKVPADFVRATNRRYLHLPMRCLSACIRSGPGFNVDTPA